MPTITSSKIEITPADRSYFRNVSTDLTASALSCYYSKADQGDPMELFKLSDEIRWKDPDVLHSIGTRSANVTDLKWRVTDPQLDEALRSIRGDTWSGSKDFSDVVEQMVGTTLLTGTRVVEMLFDPAGRVIGFNPIPSQFVTFHESTVPKLWSPSSLTGLDFNRDKVLVHYHLTSDDPTQGALIRCIGWLYLFKTLLFKDSLSFSERYGKPFLLVKVEGAGDGYDKDFANARSVVQTLKVPGGVFGPGTTMEFVETGSAGADGQFFKVTIDDISAQIAKVILGQTSTSDAVDSNRSTASVHLTVLEKIRLADARAIEYTVNTQLIPALARGLGRDPGDAKFEFLVEETRETEETDEGQGRTEGAPGEEAPGADAGAGFLQGRA